MIQAQSLTSLIEISDLNADMNSLCGRLKTQHTERSMPSLIRDIYQKNTYHDQTGMYQVYEHADYQNSSNVTALARQGQRHFCPKGQKDELR